MNFLVTIVVVVTGIEGGKRSISVFFEISDIVTAPLPYVLSTKDELNTYYFIFLIFIYCINLTRKIRDLMTFL